jgi:hypothetical protein
MDFARIGKQSNRSLQVPDVSTLLPTSDSLSLDLERHNSNREAILHHTALYDVIQTILRKGVTDSPQS